MLHTFRNPAGCPFPVLAAVVALVNPASGVGALMPGRGVVFGGCDEHDIGIAWVQNETVRIDILSPIRASPAFPAAAAIRRHIEPGATRHKDFLGITGVDERLVYIIKLLGWAVLVAEKADGVYLRPSFSRITAFQQGALFDAGVNDAGIAWIKSDELGMRDVRGSRKRPAWSAGYRAQRRKLSPVLPQIFAAEQVRR